mmetsp:Transcript_23707/g.43997  ORF Transcript_23707/g.43997 Transcript_23707/m.43997 type:complete len:1090 (+) Transcript_23707:44-3313(+)
MSLLKQIDDKGAVIEWSPISSNPNMVALGTKDSAGSGFDDYGGDLEIHKLNFQEKGTSSTIIGKAKSNSRFSSIAWSKMANRATDYSYGVIAAGMVDGTINVWDPAKLVADHAEPLISSVEQHTGAIYGLDFNPHSESSHLLASGGSDGEVYVLALDRPETPNVFVPAPPPNNAKHTADITKVRWNSQVAHILASSAQNGSTIVWDLRQKKAWCELRDPSGCSVSDISWNPDQGLHLVTAGGDDKNPVIKLWDLRSSTSLPLATLQGHREGILSISWCPNDPSLLLSCGKDNRTMLWDLFNLQPVYDLPSGGVMNEEKAASSNNAEGMFGGLTSAVGNRRYDVSWSPCLPAVISTCSFDRSVQFYSLSGAKSNLGRAPKWLRKPVGASFGFGGKLASFDNNPSGGSATGQKKSAASGSVDVKITQVVENDELVKACQFFQSAVDSEDFKSFCNLKSEQSVSEHDRSVWKLMRVICFEDKAREELLNYLGFDTGSIVSMATDYAQNLAARDTPAPSTDSSDWAAGISNALSQLSVSDEEKSGIATTTAEMVSSTVKGEEAEHMIRKALVVGNFAAAVDVCLEAGLMTEALLLAQCGDPDLWARTQHEFFVRQRKKKPFLNILQSVIKNELMGYVLQSDLSMWRETLALLSTYGKSEEFNSLCEALAKRLEVEIRDIPSATLCYMCATNVERTIEFWAAELKYSNDVKGSTDTIALQQFVEKVVVYTSAHKVDDLGETCSKYFAEYAGLLASQGILDVAPNYLKGSTTDENVLRDRLFHAGPKQVVGARPPPFPFEKVNVVAVNSATVAAGLAIPGGNAAANTFANPSGSQDMNSSMGGQQTQQQQASVQQQQQQPQQPQASAQQQQQQQQQQQPQAQQGGLPPGWIQLQDPSSNRPYYVDQSTGQSQWEPPAPVAQSMPAQVPQQQQQQQQQQQPQQQPQQQQPQQPVQMQAQQQPVQQQAAVTQPVVETPQVTAPTSPAATTSAPDGGGEGAPAELQAILDNIAGKATGGDKRQISMLKGALAALHKQVGGGSVSPDTMGKLDQLVAALHAKNSAAANKINTDLTNSVWAQHKDWIKGLKYLIQLHCKY